MIEKKCMSIIRLINKRTKDKPAEREHPIGSKKNLSAI